MVGKTIEFVKTVNNNLKVCILETFIWLDDSVVFSSVCDKNDNSFYACYADKSNKLLEEKNTGMVGISSIMFSSDKREGSSFTQSEAFLLVADKCGKNINIYSYRDFSLLNTFYRGSSSAILSGFCMIDNNYMAVSSSNKTIHIFNITTKISQSTSFFGITTSIFSQLKGNRSEVKIALCLENTFFDTDFNRKGCILIQNDKTIVIFI